MKRTHYVFAFSLALGTAGAIPPYAANASPPRQQEVHAANPKSLEFNQQGIVALKQNNPRLAEDFFRKALDADPGNLTAAYNLAGVLIHNKKKDEAFTLLDNYTKKYGDDAGLFSSYGDILLSLSKNTEQTEGAPKADDSENLKKATENYEKAFALDKSYPGLTAKLGLVYALLNRLDESEQMYLAAVQRWPQDGESFGNLSSVLLANGKPDKAITMAKEAIRIRPTSKVYVTLGSAYEEKKQFKDALGAYRRAEELGATGKELSDKITALVRITAPE